jgi:4-amino-4-deoxy-L-arabinose transferase-like glycosyltransferase
VLAAVGSTCLVVLFARRWFSTREAMMAGLIHATLPWTLLWGTSATVDMTLSFLVALSLFYFTSQPAHPTSVGAGWFFAAVACLAKGPVGPLLIFGSLAVGWGLSGFPRPRRSVWPAHVLGLLLAIVVAGTWPMLILMENPSLVSLWWEQSAGRFTEHWGAQTRPWYYYLYQVPALIGPVLVASLVGARRRHIPILFAWVAFSLLFLSLSAGKRDHYILPGLIPWSIWAGVGCCPWEATLARLWWGRIIFLAIPVVMGLITAGEIGRLPGQKDPLDLLSVITQEQRELLDRAPLVAQVGSNNHATAFYIDRPMRWFRTPAEFESAGRPANVVLLVGIPSTPIPNDWQRIQANGAGPELFTLYRVDAVPVGAGPWDAVPVGAGTVSDLMNRTKSQISPSVNLVDPVMLGMVEPAIP